VLKFGPLIKKTTAQSKWEGLLKLAAKTKLFHSVSEISSDLSSGMSLAQPGRTQSSFKDRPSLLPVTVCCEAMVIILLLVIVLLPYCGLVKIFEDDI
jgi:hypothetical protein